MGNEKTKILMRRTYPRYLRLASYVIRCIQAHSCNIMRHVTIIEWLIGIQPDDDIIMMARTHGMMVGEEIQEKRVFCDFGLTLRSD